MRDQTRRALLGFVWGLMLFFAVARLLKIAVSPAVRESPVLSQIVLKSAIILIALIGWKLLHRPFGEMGWRKAARWDWSDLTWFVIGALSMMAGSVTAIFLGFRHPIASQMSFLQIVLVIWILSSVSEEIYVRGLVQSWMEVANATKDSLKLDQPEVNGIEQLSADVRLAKGAATAFKPSVVMSALLFAALHVSLIWSPIGVQGGMTIVLSTFGLGWACAVLRDRTNSLWPAIACHIAGNVAGLAGGILGVILYFLVYRHIPEMLKPG
jgi:membrane protease YdiL (CAAX protease family)